MPIAYYGESADQSFWSGVWAQQQLDHLLAVAAHDPLSHHLEAYLPRSGVILEGGCGLGQYVAFFQERGYSMIGGDFSLTALRVHRETHPESPLVCLDLGRIPFADDALHGHVSIGVVEHIEAGPQALLREFARTLAPGGTLVLSVPWVNGHRWLTAPIVRRRQARRRDGGAIFYQYAFMRREIQAFLEQVGLRVLAFHPYSAAKGMREVPLVGHMYRKYRNDRTAATGASVPDTGGSELKTGRGWRRLVYWPPVLAAFAHMMLAIAQKPEC